MKNIWIFNHYAGEMFVSKGGRHYSIAKYLVRNGFQPVIFCSNSLHNKNEKIFNINNTIWECRLAEDIDVPFVFVDTRTYENNGFKRVLNMVDFYKNVKIAAKQYAEIHGYPDVIYASSVHPLTLIAGLEISRHFHVRCVSEIRDLWPESFISYGIINKYNPLLCLLRYCEKKIYLKSDALIFTMEGGYDYIKERNWAKDIPKEKVYFINNGVDAETFILNKTRFQINDKDLEDESIIKIVYTGSIRKVNNIDRLLDIAKHITNKKIKFLIWGDGANVKSLIERIKNESIQNVSYKGKVEKKYIPYILSKADYNIAHNTSSTMLKYGISFNKIFEYLCSNKPVIIDFESKYNPALVYGAGIYVGSNDIQDIAKNIDSLTHISKEEYNRYCSAAEMASNKYRYKNLTKDIIDVLSNK